MDDIAFFMSLNGFLGDELGASANKVKEFKVRESKHQGGYSIKRIVLGCTFISMSVVLLFFTALEYSGHYLPTSLTLQVGDDENFLMQAHNGVYDRIGVKHHNRFIYKEQNADGDKIGYFVYCGDFWGYTLLPGNPGKNWKQHCDNEISMYSPATDGFDISTVPTSGWKIEKGQEMVSLSFLKIIVNDCRDDSYCGIPLGEVYSGVCNLTTR